MVLGDKSLTTLGKTLTVHIDDIKLTSFQKVEKKSSVNVNTCIRRYRVFVLLYIKMKASDE